MSRWSLIVFFSVCLIVIVGFGIWALRSGLIPIDDSYFRSNRVGDIFAEDASPYPGYDLFVYFIKDKSPSPNNIKDHLADAAKRIKDMPGVSPRVAIVLCNRIVEHKNNPIAPYIAGVIVNRSLIKTGVRPSDLVEIDTNPLVYTKGSAAFDWVMVERDRTLRH